MERDRERAREGERDRETELNGNAVMSIENVFKKQSSCKRCDLPRGLDGRSANACLMTNHNGARFFPTQAPIQIPSHSY